MTCGTATARLRRRRRACHIPSSRRGDRVSFLPASTTADYEGARIAAHLLSLLGILSIVPGLIHLFLPDGGAGVIAGLDLTCNRAVVVGVFAWAGATQLAWGIALGIPLVAGALFLSLRRRAPLHTK